MGEMVLRTAKALAKHYGFDDWEARGCPQENLKQAARAIILTMREPTEMMMAAGNEGRSPQLARETNTINTWRCMIDEALTER